MDQTTPQLFRRRPASQLSGFFNLVPASTSTLGIWDEISTPGPQESPFWWKQHGSCWNLSQGIDHWQVCGCYPTKWLRFFDQIQNVPDASGVKWMWSWRTVECHFKLYSLMRLSKQSFDVYRIVYIHIPFNSIGQRNTPCSLCHQSSLQLPTAGTRKRAQPR